MHFGRWNITARIFTGALCALLVGWAAIGIGIWLTLAALKYFDPPPSLFPDLKYIVGIGVPWLAAFPIIGFVMGLICAVFWRKIAPMEQQKFWGIGLALVFFLPTGILGAGALCVLTIEFPLFLFAFKQSIEKREHWRHLIGLSNDYERDDKS